MNCEDVGIWTSRYHLHRGVGTNHAKAQKSGYLSEIRTETLSNSSRALSLCHVTSLVNSPAWNYKTAVLETTNILRKILKQHFINFTQIYFPEASKPV